VRLGDVFEEQGAVGRHGSSYSSTQSEESDAKPEEAGCERRKKAEDRGEEESEVEGGGTALRIGVCKEGLVGGRVTRSSRRTAAPAPSADLCERRRQLGSA
jgi:hypothetical protein